MKVAVIGSGGREHAIVKKLHESPSVKGVVAIPGNYAMRDIATVVSRIGITDFEEIAGICIDENVDWVIVGPEAPLSEGLADYLEDEHDIKVFGPRKLEAQLESSKAFSKDLMAKYDIPTAKYETFEDYGAAAAYVKHEGAPIVIKKDGLAAGKGVVVAMDLDTALHALHEMLVESSGTVVVEEFLDGEEFSLMVLVNEEFVYPFEVMAQDHKRAFDNDTGPNTGGMGAYAPVTHISEDVRLEAVREIVEPTAEAMVKEGLSYFGVMYLGAIVTGDGVKVIEFNARFGDPEAQVLMSLLESDLGEVLENMYNKTPFTLEWRPGFVAGVMLASKGYPGEYASGSSVRIPEDLAAQCFISGLSQDADESIITSGGRVLLVSGYGESINAAVDSAYDCVDRIEYEADTLFYRKDIGFRAMK